MEIVEILEALRFNQEFMQQVVAWERLPQQPARHGVVERPLPEQLTAVLQQRNLMPLYTHQAAAITAVLQGQNVVVATPTASGKSLCYTVPVLARLLKKPTARALYLFPTKALAQDQLAETAAFINDGNLPVTVRSYDGDTPQSQRRKVRQGEGIVISNPDMLHAGILPSHTRWRTLFSNLEFVVLDEIHTYRGIFGSHVANLMRRLQRICAFYGSTPQFICCSATIANPQEHAERLIEQPFTLIDEQQNGAPTGEKQFILYNPPIIDEELGLRGSAVLAAKDAAITFLAEQVQTIVFARARQTVELLLSYLQDELSYLGQAETAVTGYRGGYLPLERREIERGLRGGELSGVVATNALELGIDIGHIDSVIMTGYPGSIASTWQQAGRGGRRSRLSAAMLIASNSPLDQYICNHPRYLFGRSPESALINPDNLPIMLNHLLCAAFELPLRADEPFGHFGDVTPLLEVLQDAGELHQTRRQYHYVGENAPATAVSLRTGGNDTVVIQAQDGAQLTTIGELELSSVPATLYEGAIYMHRAQTHIVDELDWNGRLATVRPIEVDYYTRATVNSTIRELLPEEETTTGELLRAHGDVSVVTEATSYRKIKRYSHETLGYGSIELPEMRLETTGYWLIFSDALTERLYEAGILLRPNDYGPNWQAQRQKVLQRDGNRCRTCGGEARPGQGLHVHHIRPFREYGYVRGENENYRQANEIDNLVTLCPSCHRRAEAGQQTRSALGGLGYVLRNLAPLFLMCDPSDIEVVAESRSPVTQAPTIVVYERVAAGVGFSERLYALHEELLAGALELVQDCRCRSGCPACVGPPGEIGPDTKGVTRELLKILQ